MRIAIIGTGRMAGGLGKGWLKAGHFVAFGSRDPSSKNDFHRDVGLDARIYGYEGAITAGEIVVLTIPFREVETFARNHAALLRGKPVVDVSNPMAPQPPDCRSGAEVTAAAIGEGARVLAAFKGNFARTLTGPVDATGQPRDVHYCGDDTEGKSTLRGLIEDLGFRPVDCGALTAARSLDMLVPLLIEMDRRLNGGTAGSSWRFAGP